MRTSHLAPSALFVASASAVLEIGLKKAHPSQGFASPLAKRADSPSTYLQTLVNNVTGGGYYASISLGTPAQPQILIVDTGSSDTWVVASDADLCTSKRLQATYADSCGATYDKSASSTYKLVSTNGFDISYLDGSTSSGDYFTDNFNIGGATIKALQMGDATEVVRGTGIMGVSYSASVSTTEVYPNLIDEFVSQGLIATKAYSLYLNDYESATGTILFGGIDTDKFIGALDVLPILQTYSSGSTNSTHSVLAVALSDITAKDTSEHTIDLGASAVPAILDSGTTLSYLPSDIAASLFDAVGAYSDTQVTGYTFISCDVTDLTVSFTFGTSAVISVPAEMLVLNVFADVQDQIPQNVPFDNACLFGIQDIDGTSTSSSKRMSAAGIKAVSSSSYALLGDTFLRSAYVVYDMTNNEIALAQSNLNSTESKIVELVASQSGIPTTLSGVTAQQTTNTAGTATATATGTSTATTTGGDDTVTVTASPTSAGNTSGAGALQSPSFGVLAIAGVACMFSFFGGVLA